MLLNVLSLDQKMISFCSCWGDLFKKASNSFISDHIGVQFCRNVLHVNKHRLMDSDFQFDVIIS